MIKLNKVNKYFNKGKRNEIHVINDTSVELPNTGLVVFLGKSGSGKTTLLNVIGGLDRFTGDIQIDNLKLNKYSARKIDNFRNEHIGYIFQNYNNLKDVSIYENLRIALNIYKKLSLEEIEKRIMYCLKAVGMDKYKNKLCCELSGGQQQRVSIARALVKDASIIIADEPTGNLDSTNSIEVMNILKKLSKDRLVLLVTHNEELASFYGDRIIRIQDGSILSDTVNKTSQSELDLKDESVIYLKDLNNNKTNNAGIDITTFYEDDDELEIKLKLIKKGGHVYLLSDSPIELLNDSSGVRVVDDHYKNMTQDNLDHYDFSTNEFDDNAIGNRKISILKVIKKLGYKFTHAKKKTKIGYVLFSFIGAIMAFSMIALSSAFSPSTFTVEIPEEGYVIEGFEISYGSAVDSTLENLLEKGKIDSVYCSTGNDSVKLFTNSIIIPKIELYDVAITKGTNYSLVLGRNPSNDYEVVISKKLYDNIYRTYNNYIATKMSDIVGRTIQYGGTQYVICGISNENSSKLIHRNPTQSLFFHEKFNNSKAFYPYDSSLEIVSGRNVNNNSTSLEVVIPASEESVLQNAEYWASERYTIVGYHSGISGYYVSENNFINHCHIYNSNIDSMYNSNIEIAEGRAPTGIKECLASIYLKDSITNKESIVGYFVPRNSQENYSYIYSEDAIISDKLTKASVIMRHKNYSGSFKTYSISISKENFDYCQKIFEKYDMKLVSANKYYTKVYSSIVISEFTYILPIGFIGLAIVSIYSFFLSRSSLMFDINKIGILRAIGMKKRNIYCKYGIESVVVTTFSSVVGYLIVSFLVILLALKVPFMSDYFSLYIWYLLGGIVLLYLFSLLFGLLPVWNLLRKSPQEILNKYDI